MIDPILRQLLSPAAVFMRFVPGNGGMDRPKENLAWGYGSGCDRLLVFQTLYWFQILKGGEGCMRVYYLDLVVLLNFLVDFLLLLGTNRLAGYPPNWMRTVAAALIGGIYGGMCLFPGFSFLGNLFWRAAILVLISCVAFGTGRSAMRRGLVFILLCFALSGAALGVGERGFGALILAAAVIAALCAFGLRGKICGQEFIPVELCFGRKKWKLTALRDTGNSLRDPLTGEQVLVAGANMGKELFGLSKEQLSSPVETLASGMVPGMRLVPYHTIGQESSMLLAVRCRDVRIGNWRGNALVAFAPVSFGKQDAYQMLAGGVI